MSKQIIEGWARVPHGRARHYFRDGDSLCLRNRYFGEVSNVQEQVDWTNCQKCQRIRTRELSDNPREAGRPLGTQTLEASDLAVRACKAQPNKTMRELSDALDVSPSTFYNYRAQGMAPKTGKVRDALERMARGES